MSRGAVPFLRPPQPLHVIVQILISGSRALGKAFYEAGRQAAKNVKSAPEGAIAGDAAGVGNATSGSITDKLTREHRMTLDEAGLILNVKKDTPLEQVLKNYEHLYKANSPPPKPAKPEAPAKPVSKKTAGIPEYSHYLQSKVVRAKERWEAELKATSGAPPAAADAQAPPPPTPGALSLLLHPRHDRAWVESKTPNRGPALCIVFILSYQCNSTTPLTFYTHTPDDSSTVFVQAEGGKPGNSEQLIYID
ncbi:hypothetical protein NMY22_g16202 [Coprinellus aureogranulatus]|nr:hypothetical protein NMY22_g16202 [Coprinellus aureogranulatus]